MLFCQLDKTFRERQKRGKYQEAQIGSGYMYAYLILELIAAFERDMRETLLLIMYIKI